jgi:SAM-dependent methyltransferase
MNLIKYLRLAWQYRADPLYIEYLAGRKVLDVGAGSGDFVGKNPSSFIGIDVDATLVEICKGKGLNVQQMNALSLDFPDGGFDAVHASQFIEHLAPADAVRFLAEAARVLRPNGVVFLTTPGVKNVWGTFSHVRPYPPDAFVKLLESSTENYLRKQKLELTMERYWGNRFYFKNPIITLLSRVFDLIWPPRDPIGWTIILRKPARINFDPRSEADTAGTIHGKL